MIRVTKLHTFLVGCALGAVLLWTLSSVQRNRAQDRVAAAEALKDEALDTAYAIRQRLDEALRRDSVLTAERADSLVIWRERAELSEAEARRAQSSANDLEAQLRISLDSVQTVMLDSLRAETARVESSLRSELADMARRATTAEQETQRVRTLLLGAQSESSALRAALAQAEVSGQAKDAIIRSQRRQNVLLKVGGGVLLGKIAYDLVTS